ncbi:MAG TPA: GreA/GreB family elongation factor [Spirochaetota bacterium]|nr:GreA/GreB family elongation factor [Spirochaetota bacterium]HPS86043.1 GreA/GreB family elongation factor [Spirochaetota bacterium]
MKCDRVFSKHDCERILNLFENYHVSDESEKMLIETLKQQILKSKPVDAKKIKENIVTINSKIILRNIGNGLREEYHLVFPDDSDLKCRKISIFSGIGSQVLGNKVGTVIKENPNSEKYYMIEDIIYQPEASGDLHL